MHEKCQFTTEPRLRRLGLCRQPSTKSVQWVRKNARYKVNKEKERSHKGSCGELFCPEGWILLSWLSKMTWAWEGMKRKTSLLVIEQFLSWIILVRQICGPTNRALDNQPETPCENWRRFLSATRLPLLIPWGSTFRTCQHMEKKGEVFARVRYMCFP